MINLLFASIFICSEPIIYWSKDDTCFCPRRDLKPEIGDLTSILCIAETKQEVLCGDNIGKSVKLKNGGFLKEWLPYNFLLCHLISIKLKTRHLFSYKSSQQHCDELKYRAFSLLRQSLLLFLILQEFQKLKYKKKQYFLWVGLNFLKIPGKSWSSN